MEKKRNNGWWIGSLSNGKRGYFPNNYVELVEHLSQDPDGGHPKGLAQKKSEDGGLIFNSSFSDL